MLFFYPVAGITQPVSLGNRIATFTKVWGFLKYYHPEVAKGKQDWDTAFMNRVIDVSLLETKEAASNYYINWINSLGTVNACSRCKYAPAVTFNYDNEWLNDTSLFTEALIEKLRWIASNRNTGDNFYVQQNKNVANTSYENEKTYADSAFPSVNMRLLSLARYWNIIQYFFPYKYVIGSDWKNVLTDMVPKFRDAKDTLAYHLAMKELVAGINDSHAQFNTKYTNEWLGFKWPPFIFSIIDNKAVVTSFYNDTLCRENDIRIGDVFLKVDGKDIAEKIREQWKYASASNDAVKLRGMAYTIFNGPTDSVKVSFERDGQVEEKIMGRYFFRSFHYKHLNGGRDSFRIINNNTGYVNLGWLMPDRVDEVMKYFKNTSAIIFDVRNYPNGTMYKIAEHLNKEKTKFVTFTAPDLHYPGTYYYTKVLSCGKKNPGYYKGKVILLFNEQTQSHAEFTLMALKTAPNVVCIGSQTSGADGNVSSVIFPGNYKTHFTGIGVYYPDGKETQRIGIVPDIEIKPTIAGIRAGKDELVERALIEAGK